MSNTSSGAFSGLRGRVITQAVKNMQEFGYAYATAKNIITDEVYSKFFMSMLKENLGKAGSAVDSVINDLIQEIERREQKSKV